MTRASKIFPPAIPPWSISRPALEAQLDTALAHRLTTVTAGAGFGKSTLLAAWGTRTGCAWYTLDASDALPAALAGGLVEALRQRVPELAAEIAAAAGGAAANPAEERQRADALAAYLCEELEGRLGADLALVLDDVHELDPAGPSAHLIASLCRNAPPRLHLVLSSRAEPPFKVERLRARGEVLSLPPAALAFSEDDLGRLLTATLGDGAVGLAGRLHEMTGGWPAAVRLALLALRAAPGAPAAALEGLRRPGGDLFAYLAEEVFAREDPAVQRLLSRVASLDRFTAELCEAVGVAEAKDTLVGLAQRGLFVQPQGADGWFTLHGLVREFALAHWPLEEAQLDELHARAAEWFEANGQIGDAFRHRAAAAEPRELARMLAEKGPQILASGDVEGVLRSAELLPAEFRDARVEQIVGEAHSIRLEASQALECFERAAGEAHDLPAGLARRMVEIHMGRGEVDQALAVHARARLDGTDPCEEAILLASVAFAHLVRGNGDACIELSDRAVAAAKSSRDPRALAHAHSSLMLRTLFLEGDPRRTDDHYRASLEAAERAGDLLMTLRLRVNRGGMLNERGHYAEALAELDVAVRLGELTGYSDRLAQALNNRCGSKWRLGRQDEALADLERARAIYARSGSHHICWPLKNLGILYRERGDLALARGVIEEALERAEQSGDRQSLAHGRPELARLLANDEPERARLLADESVEAARYWTAALPTALIAAGWVALAQGRREEAASFGAEAAQESRDRQSRVFLGEAFELQAMAAQEPARRKAWLEEALAIWREMENPAGRARVELALARLTPGPASNALATDAEKRLRALGVRIEAAAGAAGLYAALPRETSPPVEIRTLGGFRVLRDGQTVPASEWKSKKARDLVKILLARRGRATTRDILTDALWPDEDSEKLANRLSVAMLTVRNVLDPERRFATDHFLAGDDASVWVNAATVPIDVEAFLAEAKAGLELLRRGRAREAGAVLTSAEARYTGDFLEEDLYADWSASLREEARASYVAVARALARLAAEAGDRDLEIRFRLRILERDPYDEEAHLGLVTALVLSGRHGEARRSYAAYIAKMEELGVEPSAFPSARPS
jgi:ATP/maltotriose-dependent transcriptional regulator MalT/DNA-binding SARP family transcriptional activator